MSDAAATEPPVVVDENRTFYERLTVNPYHPQAIQSNDVVQWLHRSVCQ